MAHVTPVRFSVQAERLASGETLVHGWCESYGRDAVHAVFARNGSGTITCYLRALEAGSKRVRFIGRAPGSWDSADMHLQFESGEQQVLQSIPLPNPTTSPDRVVTYQDWLAIDAATQRAAQNWLDSGPLISVLLPTCDSDIYFLERCLGSVFAQTYGQWELCIADDASHNPELKNFLRDVAGRDRRVRLTLRDKRGNISTCSNTALEMATGRFVCLLDHDDELHPEALGEIASVVKARPEVRVIYTDEDKIDELGRRFQPAFKPDFDRQWFQCVNYLGHLVGIDADLVRQVGGFRTETDGAQDWDLLLRCTEKISTSAIAHIPRPLYHWRTHSNSTALSLDAKPYVRSAWQRALEGRIGRMQLSATAGPGWFDGSMRLRFKAAPHTKVAIVLSDSEDRRAIEHETLTLTFSDVSDGLIQDADVIVFAAGGLDHVNAGAIQELTSQALRLEVACVSGTACDTRGVILSGGYVSVPGSRPVDPFQGMTFGRMGYCGQALVTRKAASLGPYFFAVRREFVSHSSVSSGGVLQEVHEAAIRQRLDLIVTPYAVATFRTPLTTADLPLEASDVDMNPNLLQFAGDSTVYQREIL